MRMTREYQLQNQMTSTAQDDGYHANATIHESDEHSLASAAQDFAPASATDRSAFEQLTSTNGDLKTQVTNVAVQNQQLQQQMSQLQQHMMFMARPRRQHPINHKAEADTATAADAKNTRPATATMNNKHPTCHHSRECNRLPTTEHHNSIQHQLHMRPVGSPPHHMLRHTQPLAHHQPLSN